VIYLDTSAALKLVNLEPESSALRAWQHERLDQSVVSSALIVVELQRACRRVDPGSLPLARRVLAGVDILPLTRDLLDAAADLEEPGLRSLAALHLASALSVLRDLTWFVTYDDGLGAAAGAAGLVTVSPGASPAPRRRHG